MTPREQKAYNDALKETQSLNRTIASQMDNLIGKSDKRNKLLSNELNIAKDIINNIESQEDVENAINKLTAQRSKINNTNLGVNNKLKNSADALLTANIQILKTYAEQQKMLGLVQNTVDSITNSATGMIDNILGSLERIPVIGGFLSDLFKPFGDTASNIIQGTSQRFMNAFTGAFRFTQGDMTTKFKAGFGAGIKGAKRFASQAMASISKPMMAAAGIGLVLVGAFILALKEFNKLEQAGENFRKSTGLLISQTGQLTKDLRQSGLDTAKLGATMEDVSSAAAAFVNEFDGITQPSEEVLTSMVTLNKNFGIGVEEGAKLNQVFQDIGNLTAEQAQHLISITAEMAKQAGVAPSRVVKDIAENSEAAYQFFGGSVEELSKAAVRAAKLGTSIGQAASVANNLLDFEQSINKEFEASAILGQNLNLNEARRLAANGNILEAQQATVEAAMALGDISKLNVYEQEALAAATGMSIPDLVRQQRIKERFGKLDEDQLAAAMALADSGKDISKLSKEDLKQKTDQLAKQQEIASVTSQLKNEFGALGTEIGLALAPLIKSLIPILKGAVGLIKLIVAPITFLATQLGNLVEKMFEFKELLGAAAIGFSTVLGLQNKTLIASQAQVAIEMAKKGAIMAQAGASKIVQAIQSKGLLKSIAQMAMSAFTSLAKIPFVGPILGAAAAASAAALGSKYMSKADDFTQSGYGKRTMFSPEGAVQFNDNDSIIAGTNLGGGNMDAVVNELRELKRAFLSNKDVYMDSVKVTNEVTRVSEKSSDNIFGLGAA